MTTQADVARAYEIAAQKFAKLADILEQVADAADEVARRVKIVADLGLQATNKIKQDGD